MTGTELLMEVMEDFADHGDARTLLVLYVNAEGDAVIKSTGGRTETIGLAVWARKVALKALIDSPAIGEDS